MSEPKVCAITLNWKQKEATRSCIESLRKLDYPHYEIIVVDNASDDGSVPFLRERFAELTIIENERNLGYAEGFNRGIEHAFAQGADYFLLLNNDTVIDKDALRELVKVAEGDPDIGFVSGKVYFYGRPNVLQSVGREEHPITLVRDDHIGRDEIDRGQYNKMRECNFIDDVFLLVRRDVFERVGGYDGTFFLYYEETDWCARVRRAGFKIVYTPAAKIWHKEHLSSGGGYNATFIYYTTRNEMLFVKRNASDGRFLKYLLFILFMRSPREIALHIKHGRFDRLGGYIKGLTSGLWWLVAHGKTQ